MSRWTSRRVTLSLAIRSEAWRLREGGRTVSEGSLAPASELAALISSLDALAMEPVGDGARLDVIVSDRWVQSFDVTPPTGVRNIDELRQLAALRRSALFGSGAGDHATVAPWHASQTFVAVTLPRVLLDALKALCHRHSWQLGSVFPQWVVAARPSLRKASMWSAVADGSMLTVVLSRHGQPRWVRTQVGTRPAIAADAQRLIDRSVLASPSLPPADQIDWIDLGDYDDAAQRDRAAVAQRFDFSSSASAWRPPSKTASAMLMAVAMAAVVALLYGAAQWQALRLEQQTLLAGLATKPSLPARRTAAASAAPDQTSAAHRLVTRLDAPWLQWLRAFEASAHPDTTLMAIEIDAAARRVHGAALARTPGSMLGYIDRLREHAVLANPQLSRHDTADKLPGQPLRFEFNNQPSAQTGGAAQAQGVVR